MVKKNRQTKKRPLSDWNKFVMEVKKQHPEKMFKDVLVLAGKLKKQGVTYADYAANKTMKAVDKVTNTVSSAPKAVTNTLRKTVKNVMPKKQNKTNKRKINKRKNKRKKNKKN